MATRDKNLKKINAELEKLSDDELDEVAGGTCYESADDSRFLNVLLQGTKYHHCDRYGATRMWFDTGHATNDIINSWKSLGIDAHLCNSTLTKNHYYLNGKEITRDEAWAHAEKLVGKHLTKEQWKW